MNTKDAVAKLDEIAQWAKDDPEAAHGEADSVLLMFASLPVRDAYERVQKACPWWASA